MDISESILFLGDVVPFKPVRFRNKFKTVINLEAPIIKEGLPVAGKINLRVKENFITEIFSSNLLCASIGNNHILDYGSSGLLSTMHELEKSGVKVFGLQDGNDKEIKSLVMEINGRKIAFLSVVCNSTSPVTGVNDIQHLSLLEPEKLESTIFSLRKSVSRIIIYIHWGIEESSYPALKDIGTAKRLIDAGADIIVGSHAHAPQAIEKYNKGIIAYNLGNFIMPALKKMPCYYNVNGIAESFYSKRLMLWNRVSWGLLVDMASMDFKIKKYIFLNGRVIELPFSPLDKYLRLRTGLRDSDYGSELENHLQRRKLQRKIWNFIVRPHIPHKFLRS